MLIFHFCLKNHYKNIITLKIDEEKKTRINNIA